MYRDFNDAEKIGYRVSPREIIDTHFERKCAVCGEVAKSETRQVDKIPPDSTILREFDEFIKHVQERGWSTAPPLCKKCRINFVCQTVEDMLPKGGASR